MFISLKIQNHPYLITTNSNKSHEEELLEKLGSQWDVVLNNNGN